MRPRGPARETEAGAQDGAETLSDMAARWTWCRSLVCSGGRNRTSDASRRRSQEHALRLKGPCHDATNPEGDDSCPPRLCVHRGSPRRAAPAGCDRPRGRAGRGHARRHTNMDPRPRRRGPTILRGPNRPSFPARCARRRRETARDPVPDRGGAGLTRTAASVLQGRCGIACRRRQLPRAYGGTAVENVAEVDVAASPASSARSPRTSTRAARRAFTRPAARAPPTRHAARTTGPLNRAPSHEHRSRGIGGGRPRARRRVQRCVPTRRPTACPTAATPSTGRSWRALGRARAQRRRGRVRDLVAAAVTPHVDETGRTDRQPYALKRAVQDDTARESADASRVVARS